MFQARIKSAFFVEGLIKHMNSQGFPSFLEKKGFEDYCEAVSIVKKKYPGMIFNAISLIFGIYKFCKKKKIIFTTK